MACQTRNGLEIIQGSTEYIYADIRADRVLDTQAVTISVSPTNEPGAWVSAAWVGAPGKFRSARLLLDTSTLAAGGYWVFAKITDTPEAPIIFVGRLHVVSG